MLHKLIKVIFDIWLKPTKNDMLRKSIKFMFNIWLTPIKNENTFIDLRNIFTSINKRNF